jgi:uncharacterized protein YjgD (DUF1641 family)
VKNVKSMKKSLITIISICFFITACNPEDFISELEDSKITAKSKIEVVLDEAMNDFAGDAKLASIYGVNVSTKGEVDLLNPTENAFIYIVQSDSDMTNEFYIPVHKSNPVKSPISFSDMLSFIKDQQAKDILGLAFNKLSEINIAPSVYYDDSPQIINVILARSDVTTFRSANPNSRIDMFLIPSKSLDTLNVRNDADWIVNFYGESSSLVLWLHPGTVNGDITVLSN